MANLVFRAWTHIVQALKPVSGAWAGNRILERWLRFDSFIERGSGLLSSCDAEYPFFERGSVDVENRKPELFGCHTLVAAGPASIAQHQKHRISSVACASVGFQSGF
jgi:hypothetical protein